MNAKEFDIAAWPAADDASGLPAAERARHAAVWCREAARLGELARAALGDPPPDEALLLPLRREASRQVARLRRRRGVMRLAAAASLALLAWSAGDSVAERRHLRRLKRLDNVLALLELSDRGPSAAPVTRHELSARLARLQSGLVAEQPAGVP